MFVQPIILKITIIFFTYTTDIKDRLPFYKLSNPLYLFLTFAETK